MSGHDLCTMSATRMVDAIRRREVSPVEITRACLDRVAALEPQLNAFVTVTGDDALLQARRAEAAVMKGDALGPLHGVPVSFKDSLATRGVRTTFGSRMFASFVPEEDAPLVERVKRAGAVILGKTTMPEFAWKAVTQSPLSGITRNPWNLAYGPGGSSGGAAAQVAAGLGPLAVGTDGGGSIRIPASFSGIYGIKPSFGRVPVHPSSAYDNLSVPGPLTRTVADAALLLSIMAGPHEADRMSLEAPPADYPALLDRGVRGLRIAWTPDFGFARVDPQVAAATERAALAFAELGAEVDAVTPEFGDSTALFRIFLSVGAGAAIADHLETGEAQLDPGLVRLARAGAGLTAIEYARAQMERHRFYDAMQRFFARYDLLLSPTVPILPLKAGTNAPDPLSLGEDWIDWSPFTFPFNLTGLPAASVPVGWSREGLPIGLQIVGRRFADLTVLQASSAFEATRPWADMWPSLQQGPSS